MEGREGGHIEPRKDEPRSVEAKRAEVTEDDRSYLKDYLGEEAAEHSEAIEFSSVEGLPDRFRPQLDFLGDVRLADTIIAVVPKGAWQKGVQPSESHVDRNLVIFNEEYFGGEDDMAWLAHELTHCSQYKDGVEAYVKGSKESAFEDLPEDYPNNRVEERAFERQFEYLKEIGHEKSQIRALLTEQYLEEDMPFLDRVLDKVFD